MKKYFKAVITLVLVVTLSTVLVWGVNEITAPIIADRDAAGAAEAYYSLVNDDAATGTDITADLSGLEAAGIKSVMKLELSDGSIAYGMQVEASGYHGITYATAVNMETKTFYGISIITDGETAGIGKAVLTSESYLNYFKGLSLEGTFDSTSANSDVTTGASTTSKGMDTSIGLVATFALANLGGEA